MEAHIPYNGAGVFNRIYSWLTDAANGVDVRADRMDTDTNDIASGLGNCITRDGQSPATANIPMGGFKVTGLATGTVSTDATNLAQLQTISLAAGTAPSFVNGWAGAGSAIPAGYFKNCNGMVCLEGTVGGGSSGTVAFTLPVGYRPGATIYLPAINQSLGADAYLQIDSTGDVTPVCASGPIVICMAGMSFRQVN